MMLEYEYSSASVKFAESRRAFQPFLRLVTYLHDLANGAKTGCIAVQDMAGSCAKGEECRMYGWTHSLQADDEYISCPSSSKGYQEY